MGKQFQGNNNRGGGAGRGGGGRGGFRGGHRQQQDQGPPAFVIPYGTYLHRSENNFVVKCTDMTRFPKFNRAIYLENKAKVGTVDEILGPVNNFYFSVKPAEGVDPSSFTANQVLYINPEDLLQVDRILNKAKPGPRGGAKGGPRGGPGGNKFGGRPQGGGGKFGGHQGGNKFGGRPQGGNFGGRGPHQGGNQFGGKPNFRR